jgi:gamma-glutamyl:cysteine ligase YbdK (ATP-grasp superfamily)
MNIERQETRTHKLADKVHTNAQQSGQASDYDHAARLYEEAGNYEQARICREAADRLRGTA